MNIYKLLLGITLLNISLASVTTQAQSEQALLAPNCFFKTQTEQQSGFGRKSCYLELRNSRLGLLRIQFRERFFDSQTTEDDDFWLKNRLFQGMILNKNRKGVLQNTSVAAELLGDRLEINIFQKKKLIVANRIAVNLSKASRRTWLTTKTTPSLIALRSNNRSCPSELIPASEGTIELQSQQKSSSIHNFPSPSNSVSLFSISTEADHEFFQFYGRRARARIRSIINSAETIYRAQLGIGFDLLEQHQQRQADQFLTSNSALTLLFQFRNLTLQENQLGQAKSYHLFTGKNLAAGALGINFQGTFCSVPQSSFGLSKLVNSPIQSLITAHEIGHGFNATHPEETLINPPNSLMTGFASIGNNSFSAFSLNEINNYLGLQDSCFLTSPRNRLTIDSIAAERLATRTKIAVRLSKKFADAKSCNYRLYASSLSSNLKGIGLSAEPKPIKTTTASRKNVTFKLALRHKRTSFTRQKIIFRVAADCSGEIIRSNMLSLRVPLTTNSMDRQIEQLKNKLSLSF